MSEEQIKDLKKDIDSLRKQKIIMQAKLKQKEDKITDLTKKVREIAIKAKESSGNERLEERIAQLENSLKTKKKQNKTLRRENENLKTKLQDAEKRAKAASNSPKSALKKPQIEKISMSSDSDVDPEELEYLRAQLLKKDQIIQKLSDQMQTLEQQAESGGGYGGGGASYSKVRKLNAKIKELKAQLDVAKRSEASMKERLLEMARKVARSEEDDIW